MDQLPDSKAVRRLKLIPRIFAIWGLIIFGKLVYLQIIVHDQIETIVAAQHKLTQQVRAPRGRILDRNGRTLAISIEVDSISVNPKQTPDLEVARDILCPLLDLDPEVLQQRMEWAVRNESGYLSIKRKIDAEESRRLRSLDLSWLQFTKETQRSYPKGSLAAQVVGTVDHEGEGNSGLELSLGEELEGRPGLLTRLHDARQQGIDSQVIAKARPGTDFGISIDERIQFVADRAIQRAAEEHNCETASVVVMDPETGDILAMANYPTFDPNARRVTKEDLAARRNNAITAPFEPGSVFKVVTFAAGLETTGLTPESPIDCGPGVMTLFGRRIHDIHAHGTIPLRMVLAKSSNIGSIQIALKAGEAHLLEYVKRFGFGQRTGIPLPGESPGLVRDLGRWTRTSIGSVAMGHEISATTLQLAAATSAIANGGLLRKPRLVLWRQGPNGKREMEAVETPRRVIQPETSITLRRLMEGVVLSGTGRRAKLLGYTTGGKTGSAQIYDPVEKRYTHRYNSSFIGFAPLQQPKVVVAIALNGATEYGGIVSAPVFQEVAAAALRMLGVVPDVPVAEDPSEEKWGDEEFADVAIAGLGEPLEIEAGGEGQSAEVRTTAFVWGPRVPDLYGLTLRSVLLECARAGMEVEFEGAGLVRAQDPPPGTVLPVGERVRVMFAR